MSICRSMSLPLIGLMVVLAGCATPERGAQRFDLQGKTYEEYGRDRYDCLERHDRLSYFVACMEARGYRHQD
jgi:hypothetical protein